MCGWAARTAAPERLESPTFDHVKFGVSDYEASKAIFLKALTPLSVYKGGEGEPAPLHLAFSARSREQVDAFHREALAAGGLDNDASGLRPHDHAGYHAHYHAGYHAHYHAASVIGPDGHNIEAVHHERAPA